MPVCIFLKEISICLQLPGAASVPELSENNGIKWMSSTEAKFEDVKDKKPTADKLERLRREKVGPGNSDATAGS